MFKEVSHIELVLENCEVIRFEKNELADFESNNITRGIARLACNSICDTAECESVFIALPPAANHRYLSFGTDVPSTFSRLLDCPDIASIDVHYEDSSHEEILFPWEDADECGCSNLLQEAWDAGNGFLAVAVGTSEFRADCRKASSRYQDADYADFVIGMCDLKTDAS